MGRVVGVIGGDGAGGLAEGNIFHAGVGVDAGEIGEADGLVLIDEETGSVEESVVVQLFGVLEIVDGFVDAVLLFLDERGVEPCGGVVGIESFGEVEFVEGELRLGGSAAACPRELVFLGVGFAEIAAEDRALGFGSGGDEEVFAAAFEVAATDASEAAPEPRVAEPGIDRDGAIEVFKGLSSFVAGGEQETFERERLGIARGELEAALNGFEGFAAAAEAELELAQARPAESEFGRNRDGLPRQLERFDQRFITAPDRLFVKLRLGRDVSLYLGLRGIGIAPDRGDELAQRSR